MNSTPQEKLILRKFYKHLDSSMFEVYVYHASWILFEKVYPFKITEMTDEEITEMFFLDVETYVLECVFS